MDVSRKTILITGGAGFLGSHLCDRLIEDGNKIICVDSLITGRLENISHLDGSPDFEFIKHDIIDPLILSGEVHEIYNLACPASPIKYELDPVHTFKTSVVGGINMLDLARQKDAKILQASTSEVYGDPNVSPQSEKYFGNVNTFGPRSCYDVGKRAAETLFHDYHLSFGIPIKVARIFNTYGPRMAPDDGRVVSNFIVQSLQGEDITIYGNGYRSRSFCYVDDLISGLVKLMDSPEEVVEPINLGNQGEFTIFELAEMVLKKTGSNSEITFHQVPVDDPHHRRPDISAAISILGWQPEISLSEGLEPTIAYFAELLDQNAGGGNGK